MCPFCIGAAAWAATGAVSAGGLGVLAVFVRHKRADATSDAQTLPDDPTHAGRTPEPPSQA